MLFRRTASLQTLPGLLLVASVVFAQNGRGQDAGLQEEPFTLSVDVELVSLSVTVLDGDGRVVPGLEREDFQIYDDGVPQRIEFFERVGAPASIGLVLDNSRSIRSNRQLLVDGALQFLNEFKPGDEAFVLHFSDELRRGWEGPELFTNDPTVLEEAVREMRPVGLTRLHDAIGRGLEDLASGRWPRKALVVLSDGLDQSSELDREALERMARSSEAAIFGIGVIDPLWGDGLEILEDLARMTGGEAVFPEDVTDLPAAWHRIARRIHGQYTIGYRPAPRFRGYHDVRVEVSESDLTVRTRDGYLVD